jgi:hypothetical protein
MQLFRDPVSPRKNLTSGVIALAFSSYQIGASIERLIWSTDVSPVNYIFLVMWVGVLYVGIKAFRLGLASVPADILDRGCDRAGCHHSILCKSALRTVSF